MLHHTLTSLFFLRTCSELIITVNLDLHAKCHELAVSRRLNSDFDVVWTSAQDNDKYLLSDASEDQVHHFINIIARSVRSEKQVS